MTESSKIFNQRQQKINEAFKMQRLGLDVEPLVQGAIRDTDELIDAEAREFKETVNGSPPSIKREYDKVYPIHEDGKEDLKLVPTTVIYEAKKPRERPIKQPKHIPVQKPGGRRK